MEQDELVRMKRDVMKLGESHLFERYTNIRKQQQEEEEKMKKMLIGTSPTKKPVGTKVRAGLVKVSYTRCN